MKYYTLTVKTNQTLPLYFDRKASLIFDEEKQVSFDEGIREAIKIDVVKKHLIQLEKDNPDLYKLRDHNELEISLEFHEADMSIYTIEVRRKHWLFYAKARVMDEIVDDIQYEIKESEKNLRFLINEKLDIEAKIEELEVHIINKKNELEQELKKVKS